ncbi:hypothetical protein AGMMS50276_02740 [Synergistales bacterium]|nr:hypothetical protein AGMMS50276_02740 [Synergistales bacterium]
MVGDIFVEENGFYRLDCTSAVWATDGLHNIYHSSNIALSDVDFISESEENLYLIEYKNANIPQAANNPTPITADKNDKLHNKIAQKFYGSIIYIKMLNKTKPVNYIFIAEYPHADEITRKLLRNKIKRKLPFKLQERAEVISPLITNFDVVSIAEWNIKYSAFPLLPKTLSNT